MRGHTPPCSGWLRSVAWAGVLAAVGLAALRGLFVWAAVPALDPLRGLLDPAGEGSLAHWAATTQLLLIGLTLGVFWVACRQERGRAGGWLALGCSVGIVAAVHGARLYGPLARAACGGSGAPRLLAIVAALLGLGLAIVAGRALARWTERLALGLTYCGFVVSFVLHGAPGAASWIGLGHLLDLAGGTAIWLLALAHAPAAARGGPERWLLGLDRRRVLGLVLAANLSIGLAFVALDYRIAMRGTDFARATRDLFNIGQEDSLPNWFSSLQMLLVALTLWTILAVARLRASSRFELRGYVFVALLFTFLAFDDGTRLHENVGTTIERLVEASDLPTAARAVGRFPGYSWHLFVLPALAAGGLFSAIFLLRQVGTRPRRAVVLGAFALFGAAVGLDVLEGLKPPWSVHERLASSPGFAVWSQRLFGSTREFTVRHYSKSLEEFTEMAATTMLWCGLLAHLFDLARRGLDTQAIRRTD